MDCIFVHDRPCRVVEIALFGYLRDRVVQGRGCVDHRTQPAVLNGLSRTVICALNTCKSQSL